MSMSCRSERSLLSHDEFELIEKTHYPAIAELTADDLRSTRVLLRGLREKETTFAEHKSRVARGKAELRGASFPGTADRPKRRRQVFANGLKRLSGEINRITRLEARAAMSMSARRALAMRRASDVVHHPGNEPTPRHGMRANESKRRRTMVPPGKLGSVSQATRNAQARHDSRN